MTCETTLQKNSLFGIIAEDTNGTLKELSSGADLVPLRSGFEMVYEVESLESDEILGGKLESSKALVGQESVSGTHAAYLRASGTEGVAPELDVLYKSAMGGTATDATERVTTSGSTTKLIKLAAGGSSKKIGMALLHKDTVNGYSIRNIKSISTNDIVPAFKLDYAPASGVSTGKTVMYEYGTTFPSFSAWLYNGNGGALQVGKGCRVTSITISGQAGQRIEVTFAYEGTGYHYNPIIVSASTNKFNITTDNVTDEVVTIPAGIYTAIGLASAVQTALAAADPLETFTCTYNNQDGKFTIATSTSTLFSILWNTGTDASDSIGEKLGFTISADDTGAVTYSSDAAQDLANGATATYDTPTELSAKGIELMIGDIDDSFCRCANSFTLTITVPTEDVTSICSETGLQEKAKIGATTELSTELILPKYDVALFDKMKNGDSVAAAINAGPKSGNNWVPGKCFNAYIYQGTVTNHSISGDSFAVLNVTVKGYASASMASTFLNFL